MKRYGNFMDAFYGAVLLLQSMLCFLMLLATGFYAYLWLQSLKYFPLQWLLSKFCFFAPAMATGFLVRRQLISGKLKLWSRIAAVIGSCLALYISMSWFEDPMHDFGLMFGSHGRWGCRCDDCGYIFTDSTTPWILFMPVILTSVSHWLIRWLRSRGNRTTLVG
jgi:hypothetical protein